MAENAVPAGMPDLGRFGRATSDRAVRATASWPKTSRWIILGSGPVGVLGQSQSSSSAPASYSGARVLSGDDSRDRGIGATGIGRVPLRAQHAPDGRPLGIYLPLSSPAMPVADAASIDRLHQPVIPAPSLVGSSVLAVVAHPDDESFGLGAVLTALGAAGSEVSVLCLTAGEASTLRGGADLAGVRRVELTNAALHLGVHTVFLAEFPDGGLSAVPAEILDEVVDRHVGDATALITFEPGGVTGHPDHRAAAAAAARAADRHSLVLAQWGVAPAVAERLRQELGVPFTSLDGDDVIEFVVDRHAQRTAIACHSSQADGNAVLARRLELQGDKERLRILRPTPEPGP